jgi:hypothetical protein
MFSRTVQYSSNVARIVLFYYSFPGTAIISACSSAFVYVLYFAFCVLYHGIYPPHWYVPVGTSSTKLNLLLCVIISTHLRADVDSFVPALLGVLGVLYVLQFMWMDTLELE